MQKRSHVHFIGHKYKHFYYCFIRTIIVGCCDNSERKQTEAKYRVCNCINQYNSFKKLLLSRCYFSMHLNNLEELQKFIKFGPDSAIHTQCIIFTVVFTPDNFSAAWSIFTSFFSLWIFITFFVFVVQNTTNTTKLWSSEWLLIWDIHISWDMVLVQNLGGLELTMCLRMAINSW